MATLGQNDRAIIAEHPLGISLDHLREPLRKIEQFYEQRTHSCDGTIAISDQEPQTATLKLLSLLLSHEVAFSLRSKIGNRSISSVLASLFVSVEEVDFNYEQYRTLSQLVIRQAPDVDIWNAVLNLTVTLFPTTPPTSVPLSFDGTPIKISSASQQGKEQTQLLIDERIFQEIRECTYQDAEGFFSKYFEGKPWTERTKEICQDMLKDGQSTGFPFPPVEKNVIDWWWDFKRRFLSNERGVYYTSKTEDLTGSEAKRQVDLFVKRNDELLSTEKHDWKDVEVIGEVKESNRHKKATLLQVGRYVREVFSSQPTRRYVHAFTICETMMQMWVFDRSGPYSSGEFNIHEKPERFIRTIAAYVMMSDEELGLDTFIEPDDGNCFVTVVEDETGMERKLQLESNPIARQRAIVCRGTTCFRARTSSSEGWRYVVKFSWVSDKRRPEADLLRLARKRGVEGVAKLFGHRRITSIADMREGLTFTKQYPFRNTPPSSLSSVSHSQPSLFKQSFQLPPASGSARKSPEKRKSVDARESPFKRSKSNSQSHDEAKRKNEMAFTKEHSQSTSLYTHDGSSFDNRNFSCLVISPAGRALRDFWSISELLKALRDAVKALRSLYVDGNILHRDVSENNIIITDPKEAYGFTGMLIDADLSKEISSGRSGARNQTGTMEFMAIQVLQGIKHTYRHDVESVFYSFLWTCARRAWERGFQCRSADKPKGSNLKKWYSGSFKDIAGIKRSHMYADGFDEILEEFPPAFDCVKPLCTKIRGILFPLQDGRLFTGTLSDPKALYEPIIQAFDKAIVDISR